MEEEKGSTDEEGAVGHSLGKKYQPSFRYMITEDDD
jgi:hypothetical protein